MIEVGALRSHPFPWVAIIKNLDYWYVVTVAAHSLTPPIFTPDHPPSTIGKSSFGAIFHVGACPFHGHWIHLLSQTAAQPHNPDASDRIWTVSNSEDGRIPTSFHLSRNLYHHSKSERISTPIAWQNNFSSVAEEGGKTWGGSSLSKSYLIATYK